MGLLEGKVALVTGAGGGLGETHALLLAQEGAAVVVNDLGGARDGSGGGNSMADQVVEKIKAMGGQAVADYGNVAKEEDANKMVQTAVEHFGKLDFLIANAGILRDKAFKNMTNEMWDIVLDVHLRGNLSHRSGGLQPDDESRIRWQHCCDFLHIWPVREFWSD